MTNHFIFKKQYMQAINLLDKEIPLYEEFQMEFKKWFKNNKEFFKSQKAKNIYLSFKSQSKEINKPKEIFNINASMAVTITY